MKRGFKKSLALLLAVFMAFGAVPFVSLGMIAFADDPKLDYIIISKETLTLEKDKTAELSAIAFYTDGSHSSIDKGARWSSEDDEYVAVSSAGVVTGKKVTKTPIMVYANYTVGDISKEASCAVTVTKSPVLVEKIAWNWKNADGSEVNALYAGTDKEYHFDYESKMYTLTTKTSEVPDTTSATLTCMPADALQINNEKKTFKVNSIDKESLQVTLTLTADGASASCQPATKTITVYRDIPITGVEWTFAQGSTGISNFPYYDKKSSVQKIAAYYFMPTELGGGTEYKFKVTPASLKIDSILELCEVTFTSADERILVFNEETGRIIPVGNGQTEITITIKTPKGKTVKDTIVGRVENSPYTPVTKVGITYDKDKTDVDSIDYNKDSNTLTSLFASEIQLLPVLNDGAKLDDVKAIEVELDNGDTIQTVKPIKYSWKIDDSSIATIDKNGLVKAGSGKGTATITLTIDDNGHKYEESVKFRAKMPWWEVLIAILMSLFTGNWSKIPKYFGMLFN